MKSTYDSTSKAAFAGEAMEVAKLSYEERKSSMRDAEALANYLRKKHSISVPDYFFERAIALRDTTDFYLPRYTVNQIVTACKKWKVHLANPSDFDRLVCNQVIQMINCHTAVLSTYFTEKDGFQLVNPPSASYAIIITLRGEMKEIQ